MGVIKFRPVRFRVICICLSAFLTSGCGDNEVSVDIDLPPVRIDLSLGRQVDELTRLLVDKNHVQSVAIGVLIDGEVTFHTAGSMRASGSVTADENSVYFLASVGKLFTQMLFHLAILDGMIRSDATLQQYLPSSIAVPTYAGGDSPILLRHLMEHSAGLPREPASVDDDLDVPYRNVTKQRLFEDLQSARLRSSPGLERNYSNFGYALLAIALETAYQESFHSLIRSKILMPAGMFNSVQSDHLDRLLAGRLAHPYSRPGGNMLPVFDTGTMYGAASTYSNVRDMLHFARQALDVNNSFNPDLLRHTLMQPFEDYAQSSSRPLEWQHFHQDLSLGYAGRTKGYKAYFLLLPNHKAAVIAFANTGSFALDDVVERIHDVIISGSFQ